MAYCKNCGAEVNDFAAACPKCGFAVKKSRLAGDSVSVWLCILSFFIPIFGLIFWTCGPKELSYRRQACGIVAIISFILSMIAGTVLGIVFGIRISNYLEKVMQMLESMRHNVYY